MAVAKWYGLSGGQLVTGGINWTTGTIKCSLHTVAYVPNQDTHDFYNDVTNEVTGTNYTTGGVTLGSKTSAYDAASNTTILSCANITFSNVTIAALRYAVIYQNTGGATSTWPLLGYIDYQADQAPAAQDFVIIINATNGLLRLTAS